MKAHKNKIYIMKNFKEQKYFCCVGVGLLF